MTDPELNQMFYHPADWYQQVMEAHADWCLGSHDFLQRPNTNPTVYQQIYDECAQEFLEEIQRERTGAGGAGEADEGVRRL